MLPRRCPRMRGKRGELRGVIILGVKEHDGIFEPNNLSDEAIDKLQKDFWNGVRNKNTVNICLLQQKDVEVGIIGRCKVIVFHIPAARREQRPVHCTLDAFNGTYRRHYEGDYLCSPMDVRRMFAVADISRPSVGRILKNFSWDDIDRPSLNQYRLLFSVARPSHPWLSLPEMSALLDLKYPQVKRHPDQQYRRKTIEDQKEQ